MGFATLSGVTACDDLEEVSSDDQFNFAARHPYNYFNNDAFGGYIKFLTGDEYTDCRRTSTLKSNPSAKKSA